MNVGYDFAVLVGGYMAAAAVMDFRTYKIPNWLTVPAAVLGLLYHTFSPAGAGPLLALAGFAVGFGLLLLPWILGGGGMGDVKMLAALGAWLGPLMILVTFGMGTVFGLLIAMGVMMSNVVTAGIPATQRQFLSSASTPASEARRAKRVVPFAVPMALATWLVVAFLLLKSQL